MLLRQPFRADEDAVIKRFRHKDDSLTAVDLLWLHFQEVYKLLPLVGVNTRQKVIRLPMRNHTGVGYGLKHLQPVAPSFPLDNDSLALLIEGQNVDAISHVV